MNNYVLFWNGIYSNWYPSPFVHNGVLYSCGEQYMMHQKAILFGDSRTASDIMATKNPKDQKALGRLVKNFDPVVWDQKCIQLMVSGLKSKFIQNPELLVDLLETESRIIAEASPYDKIWGIGLGENDVRAQDMQTWQGKNYLGIVLMLVRDEIRQGNYN